MSNWYVSYTVVHDNFHYGVESKIIPPNWDATTINTKANNYNVGDLISLDIGRENTEYFYVIRETNDTIVMLSRYPLKVGKEHIKVGKNTNQSVDINLNSTDYNLQSQDGFCY